MSWNDRDRIAAARRAKKNNLNAENEKNFSELDDYFARTFTTPYGRKVLEYLRLTTKDRILSSDAPVSALRGLEGKRQLVHEIETRIARGLKENVADFRTSIGNATGTKPAATRHAGWFARYILGRANKSD